MLMKKELTVTRGIRFFMGTGGFEDGRVKLELGLGKGKKLFEKRADIGKREWKREQGRLLKNRTLNRN